MYGKDYNYAESRLTDSIVRIAATGEPIHVQTVNTNNGLVEAIRLKDNDLICVSLDDLNLKPVPLGWCNMRNGATYLARIPKRQDWRQGIRAQTCYSSCVKIQNIPRADMARCIRGEYPSFNSLIPHSWNKVVAWSRKWASDGTSLLYGNLGIVGELDADRKPVLHEGFTYLKESLEKSLS